MNAPADQPWNEWLAELKQQVIKANKWTDKEAKLRIRDAWGVVRDGRLLVLAGGDQRPADAIPIFETLTFGGFHPPIQIVERLTGLVSKALTSQRTPRDIVIGLLSHIEHAEGPGESDEVLKQRHTAALWARRLLTLCEHEAFSAVAGTDLFWNTIICALQTGRRHAFLEICRDPQVFSDLIKAQAFQSGRGPDELTRRLEGEWLKQRQDTGREPKPRAVARGIGGTWSKIDGWWEFPFDELLTPTHKAIRRRVEAIKKAHRGGK
jgi:hypothetical protein